MRDDELLSALARLHSEEPDPQRAERVRRNCHARLAQARHSPAPVRFRIGLLAAAGIAALWFYVAVVLTQVAHMLSMRDLLG